MFFFSFLYAWEINGHFGILFWRKIKINFYELGEVHLQNWIFGFGNNEEE